MSGETLTGQDAPVVANEAQNLAPEQDENTGTTEAQTDGADGGEKSPVPKTVTLTEEELQARIERATAKAAAKAERKAFREATQRLTQQQATQQPSRDAFANDEQFQAAQLDHLAEKKAAEKLEQRERAQQAERMQEAFLEKAEKAAERYPDFQLVVSNPNLPITEAMAEYIAESEMGGDVAYFLGKNPMKAAAIAQLSAVKATRELTRIEGELAARPKAQPSKAPDPIRPVGNRGSSTASHLPSDDDPTDVWMEKERKRLSR